MNMSKPDQASADIVDALAKTIWLAEFERAFSRAPNDPWENQAETAKAGHLNTARKIIEAGFVTGAPAQAAEVSGAVQALRKAADVAEMWAKAEPPTPGSENEWTKGYRYGREQAGAQIGSGIRKLIAAIAAQPPAAPVETCKHDAIIGLDGKWHCQKCAAAIELATAQNSPARLSADTVEAWAAWSPLDGIRPDALWTKEPGDYTKKTHKDGGWEIRKVTISLSGDLPQAAPEMAAYRELEEAARHLPRATPAAGGAGTVHQFPIEAAWVWANDRALKNLDKARASSQVPRPEAK